MLLACTLTCLVTAVVATAVAAGRERMAARAANDITRQLKNDVREIQARLDAVKEEWSRQSEILASVQVVRRLTGDPDTTTGPHGVMAIMPGIAERPRRPKRDTGRTTTPKVTRARRTSTAG